LTDPGYENFRKVAHTFWDDEFNTPVVTYYKTKNALWERVDRYRSGRR
jgi:hypothetical protein